MVEQEKQERHVLAGRVRLADELRPIFESCKNDDERELVKRAVRAILKAVQ